MASGGKQKPVWEKLLESARRAATKISPKNRSIEKANHPWLSFGVTRGNSQSPKQPAPPASVVVPSAPSLQEAAASLVPSGHKTSLIQAEIVDLKVGRRIEQETEDELQATRWENATWL